MVDFEFQPWEEKIRTLRDAVAQALKMADSLGLHMVGINLNEALEFLAEELQDIE